MLESKPNMPEILLSTAAIWSQNPIEFARQTQASPNQIADMTQEAGYQGFEYHPQRETTALGRAINKGEFRNLIGSWHQSFRDARKGLDMKQMPTAINVATAAVYIERLSSLQWIADYQNRFGVDRPLTAYLPHSDDELSPTGFGFSEVMVQPAKFEFDKLGVDNLEDFISSARRKGWTGFVADLTHLQTLGNWQEVLPRILEEDGSNEIHISIGRTDALDEDPDTVQKLEDLLRGRKKAEIFQMLRTIKGLFRGSKIVDEIPATALAKLRKKNKEKSDSNSRLEDRRRIVGQLSEELL